MANTKEIQKRMKSIRAVSYTHLDVYKRQVQPLQIGVGIMHQKRVDFVGV